MQWDYSATGGFTAHGVRSWLPVGDASARNVAAQRLDSGSVLAFCRELLRLRRAESARLVGEYRKLPAPAGVWRYSTGGLAVVANFTDRPIRLSDPPAQVLLSTSPDRGDADPVTLAPWEGIIATRIG
jgi:alpha-glucosidase